MVAKKIAVTEEPEEAKAQVDPPSDKPAVHEEPASAPEPVPPQPTEEPAPPEAPAPEEVKPPDASSPPYIPVPRSLKQPHHPRRWTLVIGVVAVVVLIGLYLYVQPASNPLPKSVTHNVTTFTVYYPTSNTPYKYVAGSSNYAAGKLTYTLQSGGRGGPIIRVSEEAISGQGPDLSKLPNFSLFQAPAGEAAVGVNGGVINGILVTKKTVIVLNGIGGVSMQDFMQTINSMQA